jgi:hypothetical protein
MNMFLYESHIKNVQSSFRNVGFCLQLLFICWLLWFGSQNVPEDPYTKGLVTSLWHYWEMVEHVTGGTWWKEVRSLRAWLEGDIATLDPSSLSFFAS